MSNPAAQSGSQPIQAASLNSLKAKLESNPEDGESWLALALLLARAEPTRELRQAISRGIELLPDNYQAWLLAGLELQERQGFSNATKWLKQVAEQRPTLAAPRLALAQLHASAEESSAAATFDSIVRDFPQDARVYTLYAEYLQNQGRLDLAGDYLERALGIQPGITGNWISLAKIRLADHRLEAAVDASTRALELDTQALEARMTRAEAYSQAAQWQPAKSDYQLLLKLMPGNPFVLMGLGACLAGEGQYAQAQQMLSRVIEIKPDFVEAKLSLALVRALQGNSQQALSEMEQLMEQGVLPPAMRGTTQISQATLLEHERLRESLDAARKSADLKGLQAALNQAPALLLQTDSRTVDKLYGLAEACQQVSWPAFERPMLSLQAEPNFDQQATFIEACLLSRAAKNSAEIAALRSKFVHDRASRSLLPVELQPLMDTWQAVLARNAEFKRLPGEAGGEAWLRYWHSRLFNTSKECFPGQFKFVPNSIGLHQTMVPECLVKTIRLLLDEIHPSIPTGPGRACFMLVAIPWIHAFLDGNGRLARFVFAGELEAVGMEPILLMTQEAKALTDCQDLALYQNDFGSFSGLLQSAQVSTRELQQALASKQ